MNKLLAIIILSGCTTTQPTITTTTTSSQQTSATQTSATSAPTSTTTSATTSGATKEFTVHGYSYAFSPPQITVNKGDTVKITFISDDVSHGLCVEGYNVCSSLVSGGQSTTITFVANQSGSFAFYCPVDGHRGFGMHGTLTVQ